MTARTSRCPSGHTNSAGQKFCGECGVSLIGVCPSGHLNPEGHRYCGHCGLPLGGVGDSQTPPAGDPQPQSQIDQDEDDEDYEDDEDEKDDVLPGGVGTTPVMAGLGGLKSLWAKMPRWGKAVAVVGVLLAVSLTLANIGGRDKESYVFGYQRGSSGLTQDWVRGTSAGAKKTCEQTVDYWIDLMKKKGIDRGDAVEGCVDAVNGRPLGPG